MIESWVFECVTFAFGLEYFGLDSELPGEQGSSVVGRRVIAGSVW